LADEQNDNDSLIEERLGNEIDEYSDNGVNELKIELYHPNHIS
jgi:hypothetical protein